MLDKTTERKVGRIIDGQLVAKVGTVKNIFVDSEEVKKLEEEVSAARKRVDETRKKHILPTFRGLVAEFEKTYKSTPSLVLMNYGDTCSICEAYNEEGQTVKDGRKYVSQYGADKERIIDGIKIKQGCDNKPSEVRIYQFE